MPFFIRASQFLTERAPNERSGVDAGTALCLLIWRLWPGATHRER